MRLTYLILFILFTLTLSLRSYGEVPFYSFTPKEYRIGAEGYYFHTDANYNSRGNSEDLPAGFGYSQYGMNMNARYTWSKTLSLFSGTSLRYANSENVIDKKSTFNVPFLNLGANFNFGKIYFDIIPEVKISYPIAKYRQSEADAQTSEGVLTGEVGSHFFKPFSDFLFQTYLGYEYKAENFSSLLHYQFKLYYFYENFAFMSGFLGFYSVTEDNNNDFSRANFIAQSNGGSYIYNADEPSRYDLQLQLGYLANDQTRWYVNAFKSLAGDNSTDYFQLNFGLEYRFSAEQPKAFEYKEYTDDEFLPEDEKTSPEYEEEIKTFNKPKIIPSKNSKPKDTNPKYDIEESRKKIDKYDERTKSTKKAKKSQTLRLKKLKRVRINF